MIKVKNPNSKRRRKGEAKLSSLLYLDIEEFLSEDYKRYKEEEAKRRNCHYWSQLPPDLIHSVLERLSLRDLQRAKSVCSAWLSASRKCTPVSQVPWLVLFPGDDSDNRCKLFNPEEKDKMYTSRDLGVGFAECVCVATHGCWLLMRNPLFNLYIVNLLTGQRINLPPVESQSGGKIKLERIAGDRFRATQPVGSKYCHVETIGFEIKSPRLFVDAETKDYLVVLSVRVFTWSPYVAICKKGDHLWRQIPDSFNCRDMVYKHQKLYLYRHDDTIRISDFSGEFPKEAPQSDVYVASFSFNWYHFHPTAIFTVVEEEHCSHGKWRCPDGHERNGKL